MSGDAQKMLGGDRRPSTYNQPDNWLTREFARAQARIEELPAFARPVHIPREDAGVSR